MRRSGVALAGANIWLKAGQVGPEAGNGVLNAELVVLSFATPSRPQQSQRTQASEQIIGQSPRTRCVFAKQRHARIRLIRRSAGKPSGTRERVPNPNLRGSNGEVVVVVALGNRLPLIHGGDEIEVPTGK